MCTTDACIALRILITGGPKVGKTTFAARLADSLRIPHRNADELCGVLEWSEASAELANWIAEAGPWIIEGVAVPRALRKYFASHPGVAPCERAYYLDEPFTPPLKGQAAMAKGVGTVWREVAPELRRLGVVMSTIGRQYQITGARRPG